MAKVYDINHQDNRRDQAACWVAKLEVGLSAFEDQELQQWLSENLDNSELLYETAELYDRMSSLGRLADIFPEPENPGRKTWRTGARALTVITTLLLVLVYWVGTDHFAAVVDEIDQVASFFDDKRYETRAGEQSSVMLSDGSELTLNTDSSIRVEYTRTQRILILERGEVHVKVHHDESRPLLVWVGDQYVQAIGTAFNLEITSEQKIELIVTEGKVFVGVREDRADVLVSGVQSEEHPGSPLQFVKQGEQLIIGAEDREVTPIDAEEINVKLSWKGGNLIFRGESLEQAITEIQRYTTVEFTVQGEELKKLRVAGLFKAGDVEGLLDTLKENFDVSYRRIGEEKIILRKNTDFIK